MLRYACDISIPEIPGGVSDRPLDLGNLTLIDKSPKKLSSAPVKPPTPQARAKGRSAGCATNWELDAVVATYQENKAKIKTWQGRAKIECRSKFDYDKQADGRRLLGNGPVRV